jgi:hypothetical protein
MVKTIRIACETKHVLPLDELEPFQGNLKSLSSVEYAKLKRAILETGFAFPIYVWRSPEGKTYIVGGHQRARVLRELRAAEGYIIPPVPVVFIDAENVTEAKRRVLQDVAQYGQVERQGLYEFMHEASLSLPELGEQFRIPDLDLISFGDEFFKDLPGSSSGGENSAEAELYTKKIDSPIYEPKGEKPELEELFDTTKADSLVAEIEAADIPEEEKEFLRIAARRHVVFNYEKIAEYYAHASKPTQVLMENSALVIIDFQKAIEHGFVVLSEKIAEAYRNAE